MSGLEIECLNIGCHVGRTDEARSRAVLERLLTAVQRDLPGLLARALAHDESEQVAFIDSVHFTATVRAGWAPEVMARALLPSLLRSLYTGLGATSTVRFLDRGEMLARFLLDLSTGAAFTQAWHQQFAGLKLLPASAIVRTLVVGEPDATLTALSRLAPAESSRIVAALSAADASAALDAWLAAESAGAHAVFEPMLDLLATHRLRRIDSPNEGIVFVLTMRRELGVRVDAVLLLLARAALAAGSSNDLESCSADACFERFLAALERYRGASAREAGAHARAREVVAGLSREALPVLLAALRVDSGQHLCVTDQSSAGGAWLILPHVLQVLAPLKLEGTSAAAFWVLATCAGEQCWLVVQDSVLRNVLRITDEALETARDALAGVPRFVAEGECFAPRSRNTVRRDVAYLQAGCGHLALEGCARRVVMRLAHHAFAQYARRLPGFGDASFGHLWANFMQEPASVRSSSGGVDVALGQPPLHVIWKLSGADRAQYSLPGGTLVSVAGCR